MKDVKQTIGNVLNATTEVMDTINGTINFIDGVYNKYVESNPDSILISAKEDLKNMRASKLSEKPSETCPVVCLDQDGFCQDCLAMKSKINEALEKIGDTSSEEHLTEEEKKAYELVFEFLKKKQEYAKKRKTSIDKLPLKAQAIFKETSGDDREKMSEDEILTCAMYYDMSVKDYLKALMEKKAKTFAGIERAKKIAAAAAFIGAGVAIYAGSSSSKKKQ